MVLTLSEGVGNTLGEAAEGAAGAATETAMGFINNPTILVGGIILIAAAIILLFFLKRIIINSILGVVVWGIVYFLLGVKLPLIPSLVVSIVFGLAGIGAMLLLVFLGLIPLG